MATPDGGRYRIVFMPFGLRNALSTFQRTMTQEVLAGYIRKLSMCYRDDIIVYSKNMEKHIQHLAPLSKRLQHHGLVLFPDKCEFAQTTLRYVSQSIKGETTQLMPKHLHQMADHPKPTPKTRSSAAS